MIATAVVVNLRPCSEAIDGKMVWTSSYYWSIFLVQIKSATVKPSLEVVVVEKW